MVSRLRAVGGELEQVRFLDRLEGRMGLEKVGDAVRDGGCFHSRSQPAVETSDTDGPS